MPTRALLFAIVLLCAACSRGVDIPPAPAPPGFVPSGTGLFVSDIHFNSLADPALAGALAAAPVTQWDGIFASSKLSAYSQAGSDTNWPLLQSTLAAMRQQVPSPDVVIASGDFLAHNFQRLYERALPNGSPAAYATFVNLTEQYVAYELEAAFPKAQIVPALGNNDSTCGDYAYAGASFLAAFSAAWLPGLDRYGGAPNFMHAFATGGYYATRFPIDPGAILLVLDTQPWSAKYEDGCGPGGGNLGTVELGWLGTELAAARKQGDRVWIMGHIPPGVDTYSTIHAASGTACPASIVPFYADAYAGPLYALFANYHDLLRFAIFAHEHDDDFRVLDDDRGNPLLGMPLIPSVSPIFANNPAFVQFAYDPKAGTITDATTWYLTDLPAATTAKPGRWGLEYAFDGTYGQGDFTTAGIAGATAQIVSDPVAQASFTRYFTSSTPTTIANFTPYACAFRQLTAAAYQACYCNH